MFVVLGLGACGRAWFRSDGGADASPPDAPIDSRDASGPAIGPDAGPCNLSAKFGPPAPVTELNAGGIDAQAILSADQLAVYFMSNRAGASQAFTATRSLPTSSFGIPVRLASLDFAGADTWNVAITGDGLSAYFVTTQSGQDRMYKAKRTNTLADFASQKPMPAPVVDGEQPYVVPDGSALYYSDAKQSPKDVIVRAALPILAAPEVQASLAVPPHDIAIPVVTPDERTIYFAVYDAGVFASYDIWMATRSTATDAWSTPVAVSELDTAAFEVPSWISPDGCTLYFTRAADAGHWAIYVARKP